jgi:hypothetical protein
MVRVVAPLLPTVDGENAQDAPAGCPEQENETFWENPFDGVTEIVVVADWPTFTDREVGLAETAKSGGGRLITYMAEASELAESPEAIARALIVWLVLTCIGNPGMYGEFPRVGALPSVV